VRALCRSELPPRRSVHVGVADYMSRLGNDACPTRLLTIAPSLQLSSPPVFPSRLYPQHLLRLQQQQHQQQLGLTLTSGGEIASRAWTISRELIAENRPPFGSESPSVRVYFDL